MQHLKDNTEDQFKDLIGKRCQVIDKHGRKRVGKLDFAGVNTKLHGKFQVTLGRCPIWPVDRNTLTLHKV